MGAAEETAGFQARQVAANAGGRGAGNGEQLFNGSGAAREQMFDDLLRTPVDGLGHIQAEFYSAGAGREAGFDQISRKVSGFARKKFMAMIGVGGIAQGWGSRFDCPTAKFW